jgi:hypothetical protein
MSIPANTLWYNGDWNLFTGITTPALNACSSCSTPSGGTTTSSCVSRPPNELNSPANVTVLMGTYSDFDVTDHGGWRITGAFSNNFTAISSSDVASLTQVTWEIRQGVSANNPGTLVASGTGTATVAATGRTNGIYTEYQWWIQGLNVTVPYGGVYWVNVAPIVSQTLLNTYGTDFLIFNSNTSGTNAIGVPPGDDANDYLAIGFPVPTTYFVLTTNFGTSFHDFSNGVTGTVLPVCIDPDMMARLADGTSRKLRDLVAGDLLMTDDRDRPAKLVINHRNEIAHRVLVKMLPDSIAPGVPDSVLLISNNHKIVVDGVYKKPKDLCNGSSITRRRRPKPVHTHTLITKDGEPVYINNTLVATWSLKDWYGRKYHYVKEDDLDLED